MIELGPLGILIIGELLLVLIGLSGLLVFKEFRQKARDRQAVAKLIATVKADQGKRKEAMSRILQEHYAYAEQPLKKTVRNLDRKEKLLYQALINLYLNRDTVALQQLPIDIDALTEGYRTLEVSTSSGSDEDGEGFSEMQRLRGEKEQLAEELRITMDAMGRMLSEYSSMFAGSADNDLDKEKMQEQFKADNGKTDDASNLTGWPAIPEGAANSEAEILEQLASEELDKEQAAIESEPVSAAEAAESTAETQVINPDQMANAELEETPDKQTLSG